MIVVYIFNLELVIQCGVFFCLEIWSEFLCQIGEYFWFGYGYDYLMWIKLVNGMLLVDLYNIELGVLFVGGIVGLLLWFVIYVLVFVFVWKNCCDFMVLLVFIWLVFGLVFGFMEGNVFMFCFKEYWFLIWILLVLLYVLWVQKSVCDKNEIVF